MESPIEKSNFSITSGPVFHYYNSLAVSQNSNTTHELSVSQQRLNVPVSARYTFFHMSNSPFFEIGVLYSGAVKNKSTLLSSSTIGDHIYLDFDETPVIPDHQTGVTLAGGVLINYDADYSFMLQVEYNRLYPIQSSYASFAMNGFLFTLGLLL